MKRELKGFVVGVLLASLVVSAIPTMTEKVTKSAELLYNNIKVVIDGKQADLKDAQGNTVEPFIIDGTTYLPVRAVSNALNKAVSWDGATQTVYLGKNEEIEQPSVWLKDLETFTGEVIAKSKSELEFGAGEYNGILTSNNGDVYENYIISSEDDDETSYLLNYKYSRFKGTLYLTKENKNWEYATRMLVYGDDKLIYKSKAMGSGIEPIEFDIDVSNVAVLKIVYQCGYTDTEEGEWNNLYVGNYWQRTPIGNAGLYE